MEKLRWRIAYLMDRLPGQCWANLVSFALGSRRSPWQPVDDVCRDDRDQSGAGACYCGKLRSRP
jgi:hypothetical protein